MKKQILTGALLTASVKVFALQCFIDNSPILDFGVQDPFVGGNVNTTGNIQWRCTRNFLEGGLFGFNFTMCIYAANDESGGLFPRNMTTTNPGPAIPFNVYTDASGSNVMQPSTNAIPVPVNLTGLFGLQDNGSVPVFGIAPGPLPGNVLAEVHNTNLIGSQVTGINTGQSCNTAAGTPLTTYTLEATMEIQDQCQFTANDLDFGTQSTPLAQTDADTFIDVRCTNTTPFTVGLNEGSNFAAGSRRMSDGANFVDYGLFQNATRSTEWDNTSNRRSGTGLGTGSSIMMTVFGRIPADPTAVQGTYSDTVTVDIVF